MSSTEQEGLKTRKHNSDFSTENEEVCYKKNSHQTFQKHEHNL